MWVTTKTWEAYPDYSESDEKENSILSYHVI